MNLNSTKDLISNIKSRVNIVGLTHQLGLNPNKKNVILSIYKKERNPSLQLYPKTNSFYCFTTGRGGDVINFYADYKNIDNKEAIKQLCDELGIDSKNDKKNHSDLDIDEHNLDTEIDSQKCIEIYQSLEAFCNGVDDKTLLYLTGPKRGLTEETIKKFRLFSIKDIKETIDHLHESYNISELIASGLFNQEGKFILRNHRLIIPYLENDQIVYLRGRIL